MEYNSDKAMRDKLRNVEVPFDPGAWEQMDAMLDEKRKPKGFFWWWFGGVAACLILGAGMYVYQQFGRTAVTGKTLANAHNTPTNSNKNVRSPEPESSASGNNSNANSTSGLLTESKPLSSSNQELSNPSSVQKSQSPDALPIAGKGQHSKAEKPLANSKPARVKQQHLVANHSAINSGDAKATVKKGKGKRNKHTDDMIGSRSIASANRLTGTNHSGINGTGALATSGLLTQTASGTSKSSQFESITLNPVLTCELRASETLTDDLLKQQEGTDVNLKKLRRKIFNYSLGVSANITGATLGRQSGVTVANAFSKTPSYMAGFTHDFMFFKRFAFTNSILFSQTSFNVSQPKTTYAENLDSYTSNITELTIPTGIKVYAISQPKFRFYMAAGIINHIKLKETFTYQFNNTNAVTGIAGGVLPSQTQFTGNVPNTAAFANLLPYAAHYSTSDFSINYANRYYASFYASAGAEFIVHRHYVFFTEPLFYMALEKIGVQNKYKYNLGLSGGFRYQF